MRPRRRVPADEFMAAYAAWPGSEHDKTTLKALLLRYRIEAVAARLPSTVVVARGDTRVRQRLMLAVGEPGLDDNQRAGRLRAVRAAAAAYDAICDVLHGRDPEGRPPLALVAAWEDAVVRLEQEFSPRTVARRRGRPPSNVRKSTRDNDAGRAARRGPCSRR